MYVNFLSIAKVEMADAIDFYNEQSEGLGYNFANEVKRTINRIMDFPDSWPKLSRNTRRARISRFPYGIIYSCDEKEILIIAIMHLQRKPLYWKDRV